MIGPCLDENPKKFWSHIRNCKSEDNGIPPLRSDSKLCSTDKDKAEALNSYFYSFFKEELPAPFKGNSQYNFISDLKIFCQGVLKQLNSIKARGPDESPTRVLKELAPAIALRLCSTIQQSYDTDLMPSD